MAKKSGDEELETFLQVFLRNYKNVPGFRALVKLDESDAMPCINTTVSRDSFTAQKSCVFLRINFLLNIF